MKIVIEWSEIQCEDDFYTSVFKQCESPTWHARNLDALADSWVTASINGINPPYTFVFLDTATASPSLFTFLNAVKEIAEESIRENGGSYSEL